MNNIRIPIYNLKQQIENINNQPGVYKIISIDDEILYIGKAKNLKKRLTQYTISSKKIDRRIQIMISKASKIEVITTENESQALILEACLIKSIQPTYNIKLRDDKNYPYIAISKNHQYPRIMKYHGEKKNLQYFGPFTCSTYITLIISIIQKIFKIRICSDTTFKGRNRPCLEYYINRCSAPCMNLIKEKEYHNNINNMIKFLNGEINETKKKLYKEMLVASKKMQYELANEYKNTITAIKNLHLIKSNKSVSPQIINADFIAIKFLDGFYCIQIFFFRNHCNIGNQIFFSQQSWKEEKKQILTTFIIQFYYTKAPAEKIYTNIKLNNINVIEDALFTISTSKHKQKNPTKIKQATSKNTSKSMDLIEKNVDEYLQNLVKKQKELENILNILAQTLNIPSINIIEAYDNSHNFGDCPIGAVIAADKNGFLKKMYKKFNIKTTSNNDYTMLQEVLTRRFKKIDKIMPDLLLIDGGPGHAAVAEDTMKKINITIPFLCIAKGVNRNSGMEKFYKPDRQQIIINDKKTLLYLQSLRDEVHRFAISNYRKKKNQKITNSILDKIPDIGPIRRNNLMKHFKSIENIINSSVLEISRTKGFSISLAEKVYKFLKKQ